MQPNRPFSIISFRVMPTHSFKSIEKVFRNSSIPNYLNKWKQHTESSINDSHVFASGPPHHKRRL